MPYYSGSVGYSGVPALIAEIAAENSWEITLSSSSSLYIVGVGISGEDRICCGVSLFTSASGHKNIEAFGSVGDNGRDDLSGKPFSSGGGIYSYLIDDSIAYKIVCNPSRIIVIFDVEGTSQHLHLGFASRLCTEKQYPYPMLIGGMGSERDLSYGDETTSMAAYWGRRGLCSGRMWLPGGGWANIGSADPTIYQPAVNPLFESIYHRDHLGANLGGGQYSPEQIILADAGASGSKKGLYSVVDGLYWVPGNGLANGDTITINYIDHIVAKDGMRDGNGDFCCLRWS